MASIKEKIINTLRMYNRATRVKTLQTMEEIEANTESNCLAGAGAVAELNNKLAGQPEWIKDGTGKITGYKTGGADTVFPFSSVNGVSVPMYLNKYGGGYGIILLPTFGCDSVQYFIGGAGNFIIGLTTSFPTDIASLRYSNITGIRSGAYGYRQVISQKLNIGNSGNIATKGYKGIYIEQTEQSATGLITITYR